MLDIPPRGPQEASGGPRRGFRRPQEAHEGPQDAPGGPQEAPGGHLIRTCQVIAHPVPIRAFCSALVPPHTLGGLDDHMLDTPPGSPRKPQRGLRRPQEAQEPQEASGGPQEAPGGHKRPPYQNLSSYCTSGADSLMFSDLVSPPYFGGPRRPPVRYPPLGAPGGFRKPQRVPGCHRRPRRGPQEAPGGPQEAASASVMRALPSALPRHPTSFFVSRRAPADLSTSSPGLVLRQSFFPKQLAERGAVVVEANSGRGKAKQ